MLNRYFLDFIESYVIYFIILFYFNYLVAKTLKFFIKHLIGYDLWTYIEDSFRLCPNNTIYDISSDTYILDYEYININEMIYYNKNFLAPYQLELIYYSGYIHETKNREEDDHELYGAMSTYLIPLQYKYYTLEHYWPEDEKVSIMFPNFHDFEDLKSEFKFIYEDYKSLWPNYKKFLHTRELFYNDNLYDSKILQVYFYNAFRYIKAPLSYLIMLNNKKIFWKKESRTFDLIEPSQELCRKKHMTWFLLKCKYDEAKFEYDVFCNLPPYEVLDSKYYDFYVTSDYNLIDLQTKRHQYLENKDEYFFDFINSRNLINYYFQNNLFSEFYQQRFYDCEYDFDKPFDPFDYLFFLFVDRALLMVAYLFMFYYYCFFFFFFFFFFYCWYQHIYAFDFDLYVESVRMLTRNKNYNDYSDYNSLIFNYKKNDINHFFYDQNIRLEFELYCKRDRLKFNSILRDVLFPSETVEPKLDIRDLTDIKEIENTNIFLRDSDRKQLIQNYFLRTYKYFL